MCWPGRGNGASGVNLFVYGPVGTGKTEFCKTLAAKCGLKSWSVGENDDQGGEPVRPERLASLRLAQHLLKYRKDAVILFEEAEDLLDESGCIVDLDDRSALNDCANGHINAPLFGAIPNSQFSA